MRVFLWCTRSIWMAQLYVLGSLRNSGGIVGSLQVRDDMRVWEGSKMGVEVVIPIMCY